MTWTETESPTDLRSVWKFFLYSAKDDDGRYSLGEFDYTSGSGWMYSVNGSFPNYGFADYFPQDGDVVRVCFTLALGRDVGGGDSTGGSSSDFAEFADYARVNKLLALIRENEFYGSGEEAYAKRLRKFPSGTLRRSLWTEYTMS